MPTLKDLLTTAGATLPEGFDLANAIESSDEVKGLVQVKTDLLAWKTENKPLLESLTAEKEALKQKAKEDEDERLRLAKENGDYKTQLEIETKRTQELVNGLNASREKALSAAYDKAISETASLFKDSVIGKDFALSKVDKALNEAGDPVITYKLGDQTFSDLGSFKEAAAKVPSYASMMAGSGSQGTPAGGQGNPGGGKLPDSKEKTRAEAVKNKDFSSFVSTIGNKGE